MADRVRRKVTIKALAAAMAAAGLLAAYVWMFTECDICDAANEIILRGTVAQNCTISVAADAQASNLPLTTIGVQRIQVGSVTQSCNKKTGYTLVVTSTNCGTTPTGAKVADPVGGEYLTYSAEFNNPTTGGSQSVVTGLLASACAAQNGRDVTNAKIRDEISTVFINFTGTDELGAGTYQDTLTISMNVK